MHTHIPCAFGLSCLHRLVDNFSVHLWIVYLLSVVVSVLRTEKKNLVLTALYKPGHMHAHLGQLVVNF